MEEREYVEDYFYADSKLIICVLAHGWGLFYFYSFA